MPTKSNRFFNTADTNCRVFQTRQHKYFPLRIFFFLISPQWSDQVSSLLIHYYWQSSFLTYMTFITYVHVIVLNFLLFLLPARSWRLLYGIVWPSSVPTTCPKFVTLIWTEEDKTCFEKASHKTASFYL